MDMFNSDFDYKREFIDRWNDGVKRARGWMVVLGVLLILAGGFAALAPLGLYEFIQTAAGIALIVYAVMQIASYMGTPEFFRSPALAVMGVLNALLGIMLLALPAYLTAGTLVFLLGFLFIVTGIERLTFARRMRYFQLPHTGMGIATGIINLIVGIVFLLMPMVSSLVLGYLMAAYLVVGGVTVLIEAAAMRSIDA